MSFHVHVLEPANRDVDKIYFWLRKRSRLGAVAWHQAFLDAIDRISQSADTFAPALEAQKMGLSLRQAFFKTRRGKRYRIVFVVEGDQATVMRIRGPGQRRLRRGDIPQF